MEQFLVSISEHLYQVDPLIFYMENTWFIVFEVIDFETKKPLNKDEVLGKACNFNLLRVNQYRHFKEDKTEPANSSISQIIYQNITKFFSEWFQINFAPEADYYIYDTIVLSNKVQDVEQYLCSLIATKNLPSQLVDISSTKNYQYYPQDGVALITHIDEEVEEVIDFAMYNSIQLEAIKLYIFLSQIINNESVSQLNKVIRNNLYLENLFFAPNVPIETHQLLKYIYQTTSYQHYKKAIELKISYMSAQNESKKNHNSLLLNILLYIIALISAMGSLDTISCRLGIPYVPCLVTVVIGFLALGILWLIIEMRREK